MKNHVNFLVTLTFTFGFLFSLTGKDLFTILDHYRYHYFSEPDTVMLIRKLASIHKISPNDSQDSCVTDSADVMIKLPINKPKVLEVSEYAHDAHEIHDKEWFALKGFKYDLDTLNWKQEDIILFANILSRESGSTVRSVHQEIDMYLVAIAARYRFLDKGYEHPVVKERTKSRFVGAYSMEAKTKPKFKKPLNEKAWNKCYEIVSNVLSGNIPDFVPYIPNGTHAYLNSRLDTDQAWINACTTKWVVVASTIKDHHYYANPDYFTAEEEAALRKNPFNPVNTRFKDGLFAKEAKMAKHGYN